MNELIKVSTNEQGEQVVSAKELYESLGYDRSNWSKWYRGNIAENPFAIENQDFAALVLSTNANGTPNMDFALSLDFAKRLAMMAKTEKGERVRLYFLECEKKLKEASAPLSRKDLALMVIAAEEENERLVQANQNLTGALDALHDWISIIKVANHTQKKIGIYKITSPTGKVYIGQTIDYHKRIGQYSRLGCKSQSALFNSLTKHGYWSHSVELIEACDVSELNERERFYQDKYKCVGPKGLNCRATKSTDKSGFLSEQTKVKMKARVFSEETRAKISKACKGRKASAPQVENNRKAQLGKKMSEASKEKIRLALMGRAKTKQHIENMKSCINPRGAGMKRAQEVKDKMSRNSGSAKLVLNVRTGIFYDSCKKAAESTTHMSRGFLNKKLSGWNKNKTDFIYV